MDTSRTARREWNRPRPDHPHSTAMMRVMPSSSNFPSKHFPLPASCTLTILSPYVPMALSDLSRHQPNGACSCPHAAARSNSRSSGNWSAWPVQAPEPGWSGQFSLNRLATLIVARREKSLAPTTVSAGWKMSLPRRSSTSLSIWPCARFVRVRKADRSRGGLNCLS